MDYDSFKTLAFTKYGINAELLEVVGPWVEKNVSRGWYGPASDMGYRELQDIQTLDQAMLKIKEMISMATLMETPTKTARAKKKFYKLAGGREGYGIYRYVLKAYYLARGECR